MALIKCPECGKEISDMAQACPHCGYSRFVQKAKGGKNKILAGILCLFFWGLGIHELYLGSIKRALLCIGLNILIIVIAVFMPILGLLAALVPLIWAIVIFAMPQAEFDAKYNGQDSPKTKTGCLIAVIVFALLLPIIGIITAISIPQYFKAVEKARANGAIAVVNNIAESQQAHYEKQKRYAVTFQDLDINLTDKNGEAAKSTSFNNGNFTFNLRGRGAYAYVEAKRNDGKFQYAIRKYYMSDETVCIPEEGSLGNMLCDALGLTGNID